MAFYNCNLNYCSLRAFREEVQCLLMEGVNIMIFYGNTKKSFLEKEIDAVWEKAAKQPNNNPDVFRKDYAGAWIRREDYGKRNMPYGWEIDHLKPLAKDGTHDLDNLYPVHWRNNESKGDDYPRWKTVLSSKENKNVESDKRWKVDE